MADADSLQQEAADNYQDAKDLAVDARADAQEALDIASEAVQGLDLNYNVAPFVHNEIAIDEARTVIPAWITASDYTADVKDAFAEKFDDFEASVKPQIESYLTTFFPDISDCIKENSDEWICGTILNGRFVPVAVETAIYERQRDRESGEMLRNEQGILDSAAARGFEVPQGVEIANIAANQQDLSVKMIGFGRDLAMKAFDVANENTKFAITQAVSLRTGFVNALGNFIRMATEQQNQAVDYARLIKDTKGQVFENALNYYQAKFGEEKFRKSLDFQNLDQVIKNANYFIDGKSKVTDAEIRIATVQANTAVAAAEGLFRVAAAAYATRNTMINVAASV
jgi:hypothetical protein